jgi:hypothetical protein
MSRAESLAAATDYLFQAVFALDGAARVLDGAGVLGAADQARGLHDRGDVARRDPACGRRRPQGRASRVL